MPLRPAKHRAARLRFGWLTRLGSCHLLSALTVEPSTPPVVR